jgi:HEAT repeat protein
MEPVFGGREDTAAPLRALSALGLARMLHPEAMLYLADLLADPVLDARLGAVKAIASAGQPGGAPLLRFKARSGDPDARVMYAVFEVLLEIGPESSLALVAEFLEAEGEAVAEAAALALGESRLEGAFDILRGWAGREAEPDRRSSALTAIALLRTDRAIDYLLGLISSGPVGTAREAVAALKVYESDRSLWARVEKAAAQRGDEPNNSALRFPHLMA